MEARMIAKLASATALALILGGGAAVAQSGGDARNNDRKIEKALDDQSLTPVRPIRRVGPNDWPAANNATAGQSTEDSAKQDPAKQNAATQNQPANQPKQDAAKQEAPKQEAPKQDTAKQDAAKQEAAKQEAAKQEAAKQEAAKQEAAKQDAAKQDATKPGATKQAGDHRAAPNNATNNSTASGPAPQDKKDTAQGSANPQQNAAPQQAQQKDQQNDHGFASIRLGTDAQGRVAVNDEQERQITAALRKQRVQPVESSGISVKVGAVAPAGVRLGTVSSDLVAVLPQFRGYSFFAGRDEIAIVEPGTRKIVALVPVKLTATASAPAQERSSERSASAPAQERSSERSATTRSTRRSNGERDVTVGAGVPSEDEILQAPTTRSRSYRTVEPSDTVIIERRRRPAWLFGFGRF
jgi:hypothetical protein